MWKFLILPLIFLTLNTTMMAQRGKTVVVKAGTKVVDYFSKEERYRYPEFRLADILLKNGKSFRLNLNYDILFGEMMFVQNGDTLAIAKKKDIKYIALQDTFYYDNGFIESITDFKPKAGVRRFVKLNNILKKGAYGTTARAGTVDTYESVSRDGNSFDLVPAEDIELKTMTLFYILNSSGAFVEFSKKNLIQLYPEKAEEIKSYIKEHKISFDSRDNLVELATYVHAL